MPNDTANASIAIPMAIKRIEANSKGSRCLQVEVVGSANKPSDADSQDEEDLADLGDLPGLHLATLFRASDGAGRGRQR
jgi:hypothetical protein